MINSSKLKGRIVEKGETFQSIAPKIGCSAYTLGKKVSGETPINLEEITKLCKILEIKDDEFSDFFLQNRLQNATRNEIN